MKYLILGTSSFTVNCALAIKDSGHEISSMISLPKKQLPDNSADIEKIADQLNVPYHEIENINDLWKEDSVHKENESQKDFYEKKKRSWDEKINKLFL